MGREMLPGTPDGVPSRRESSALVRGRNSPVQLRARYEKWTIP